MKIVNEVVKNFSIIFRSWVSLVLLVLGPLGLILLIGFTFGSQDIHSAKIGMVSGENVIPQSLLQNLTALAEVRQYAGVDECITDLKRGELHLCMEVSGEQDGSSALQRSFVKFTYDPSRAAVSSLLIKGINDLVGESSERISIESTRGILDNIQNMVSFLADKRSQVDDVVNESEQIRASLIVRRDRLAELDANFTPRYAEVKKIQQELGSQESALNSSKEDLDKQIAEQRAAMLSLRSMIWLFPSVSEMTGIEGVADVIIDGNTATINLLNGSAVVLNLSEQQPQARIALLLAALNGTLSDVDNSSAELSGTVDDAYGTFASSKSRIDAAVGVLDILNGTLKNEIMFTNESIMKIEKGVSAIQNISADLDSSLAQFSFIDPSTAEKIINPLLQEYKEVKEVRPIQRVFAGLLVMVLVFITLLFANILTLSEVNSAAYFRNLIAPVSTLLSPAGILLTNIFLVLFQATVLLLIAQTKFGIPVFSYAIEVYSLSLLLIVLFSLIGMGIAYFFPTAQTSILTTTFLALAFYLFSSIPTPLELMPQLAAALAQYNPVVMAEELFRKLIIYGVSITDSQNLLILLGVYIIGAALFVLAANKKMVDRFK